MEGEVFGEADGSERRRICESPNRKGISRTVLWKF